MAPAARIVAYFIGPDGQVAADSLQFHVDASKLHLVCLVPPLFPLQLVGT